MYNDTITVFNRFKAAGGDIWFPSVLHGVDLNADRAAIVAKYGDQSTDEAILHIRYEERDGARYIGDKEYLSPKMWAAQKEEDLPHCITFNPGSAFDFFVEGEWEDSDPVSDDDYLDGFYNFANKRYDQVYAVSSVAMYSVIPHFEITGK